jgi:hypothetical protein
MTHELMAQLIVAAGVGQAAVLVASALVPFQIRWREELQSLGAFSLLSVRNAHELAAGGPLARGMCAYVAVFWGVRLGLQAVFDVKSHLTTWWLRAAYRGLSVLFAGFTAIYTLASLGPAR